MLLASYQSMLKWYDRLAPMQSKLMKYMKKELDDIDESERWRVDEDEDEDEQSDTL